MPMTEALAALAVVAAQDNAPMAPAERAAAFFALLRDAMDEAAQRPRLSWDEMFA